MRLIQNLLTSIVLATICGSCCDRIGAEDLLGAPSPDISPPTHAALTAADAANLEGCQVIARVDDQIILACDVLWRVNAMLEAHQQSVPADQRVPDDQLDGVRQKLMQKEVASMVDRKLLYNEFRRNVPAENLPKIEENLRQPFEEHELPQLMKELKVDNERDLEKELARLGSSMADVRRTFNERVIASEWIRSKVKVSEDVSPEEMLEYYRKHETDYDYPSEARWEELVVRKSRFKDPAEAYAEIARMGNEVWQKGTQGSVRGAAFAVVAKAKSDGFTAKKGGVHDWTTKGALECKALDNAIFTLKVGQMSPIIDDGDSFHIVRVLERKDAGRKPFIEVQDDIRDKLKEEHFHVEAEKYLSKLRQDARIWTVYTGNVSADVLLGRKPSGTQTK
ncbi:MAG TPA: peptidylprolyl isomerase [Lacipirellulaceae bacterium]|nr:peptidylprolyl isomerase [Lacipirellulaceae bacterium]